MNPAIKLVCIFMLIFTVSLGLNQLVLKFASNLGIRGKNNILSRWNQQQKPSLGGITMFISIITAVFIYLVTHSNENVFGQQVFLLFFLGLLLSFFMGLFDDAYDTFPFFKLIAQAACGVLIVMSNNTIPITQYFELNAIFTVVWTIGLMNSINMLDNMDGIAAGTSLSFFMGIFCIDVIVHGSVFSVFHFLLIGFMAALFGFLWFNKPPSKMFMGDSGSQLIGYIVAFFSVHMVWDDSSGFTEAFWIKFLTLTLLLALPLIDTFTVIFNRIKARKSPFKGGKDHTTHHLAYFGYSEKHVFKFFLVTSAFFSGLGFLTFYLNEKGFYYELLILLIPLLLLFYFLFQKTHLQNGRKIQ